MSNKVVTENDIGSGLEIVANKLKTIPLTKADVGLNNVDNTSDVNKPISSATQTALDGKQNLSEKNQNGGYAGLDSSGKIQSSQLPAIAISDTFVVGSQSAMLALSVEIGDVAVRTDLNKTFILKGSDPTQISNWQELLTPTDLVSSVFGRNGAVVANSGDYNTSQVPENGNLYFTQARVSANTDVVALLAKMHDALTLGTNQNGLSLAGQVLQLALASGSANGALSASDWNTFNNKLSSITSAMIVAALGFTPYSNANPSGFLSSVSWSIITGKPTFAAVATSGNYNDLSNKPTIPAAQVNSDWNATSGLAQILNKPALFSGNYNDLSNKPTIPTNTNQLTNGAGFITGYTETDTLQSVTNRGASTTKNITAPAFFQTSDERLKNILDRDGDVIYFKWIDLRDDKVHIGYVAQEVRNILPEQVNEDEDGILSVNYTEVLVDKVRKLENIVEHLMSRIDELERISK